MTKLYGTPGPRLIYPELCTSPSMGRCGLVAQALWPRLVAMADDQGRLAGGPEDIRVQCFAKSLRLVTTRAVATALSELADQGHVRAYEVGGEPYLQLEHWWTWQAGMRRAYPSRWPAPDGWEDRVFGRWKEDGEAVDNPVDTPDETPPAAARSDLPQSAALGRLHTPPRAGAYEAPAHAAARRPARTEPKVLMKTKPSPLSASAAPARGGPAALADLLPPPPGYNRRMR